MSATADIVFRLESVLGSIPVIHAGEELREYAVDGVVPSAIVRPSNAAQVVELVRLAQTDGLRLIPSGSRSKLACGMPPSYYDIALDMRGLQQIAHYDAGDMTLSVDAGMSLRQLESILLKERQFLPLAVPCYESSTVGGTVASGIDSVLRQRYGSVRDFLIGAEFVDGKGTLCKSGGRVVKNVTGYDLHKLLVGSLGTLGVITRLNFRTFPLPPVFAGFAVSFASVEQALAYKSSLEAKGLPLTNLEVFDPTAAQLMGTLLKTTYSAFPLDDDRGKWHVYASCDGSEAVVQRVCRELQSLAAMANAVQGGELSATGETQLSGALRDAFDWLRWSAPCVALFRITFPCFTPAGLNKLRSIASAASLRSALVIRAKDVIYLAVMSDQEQLSSIDALSKVAEELFSAISAAEGCAILLHAPQTLKQRINIWGPRRADDPLMQRVKFAFDPKNIFAPGRFLGGL